MKVFILGLVIFVSGVMAATALADKPPAPPGKDPCSHGNTGKPCRPDPQPDRGKDCEKHGKEGGVNEDHCRGETTPPPTTTEPPVTTTEPPGKNPPPRVVPPDQTPPGTTPSSPAPTSPASTTPASTTPTPESPAVSEGPSNPVTPSEEASSPTRANKPGQQPEEPVFVPPAPTKTGTLPFTS